MTDDTNKGMERIRETEIAARHALFMARHYWAVPVLNTMQPAMFRLAAQAFRDLADACEVYADNPEIYGEERDDR